MMMTNGRAFDKKAFYQIRVLGRIDPTWSDWFDSLKINCLEGETLLTGFVEDQSALLGILTKITSLGLTLITVKRKEEFDP